VKGRLLVLAALACSGAASAQGQSSDTEGRRADLTTFRRYFFEVDSSYSAVDRAAATSRLARLEAEAAGLTAAQFELELARIVALADNGHTNSPAGLRSRRYTRIPLRLVPLGGNFYVARADTAHADLLGARLVAIDGKPISEVRAAGHTLWGGTPAWRDRHLPFLLESPEQMQVLGVANDATSATYRFELRNGRSMDRRITAAPPDPQRDASGTSRWLYPDPLDSDRDAWRHVAALNRMPWAFQEVTRVFRTRMAPELDGMVVQLRTNVDGPGQSISEFLQTTSDDIRRVRPRNLVLDLRTNGGGDLNNTRDFVQSLPTLVPGRIFVLTSPWTFSAAISTTGYLKQAGGDRVTIVGEMVGDRLEFWAEGRLVHLPNSGAAMSYSTQRHDYKTGCRPYSDCHGSVVRNPIAVASLAPDIEAPITIESLIEGRDPGMEAITRTLRRSRNN
jgi:hypothetical protein